MKPTKSRKSKRRRRSKSRKSKTRRSRFGGSVLSRRRRSSPRRRAASSLHTPSPYTHRVNDMYIAQGYLRPKQPNKIARKIRNLRFA